VLKNQQPTYDSAQIQDITTYIKSMDGRFLNMLKPYLQYVPEEDAQLPPLPDTLEWIPGGKDCGGLFDLTNAGTENVQILGMGATLMSPPVQNSFAYHLLSLCSVDSSTCGAGGGYQCYYTVGVKFQGNAVGTHLDGQVQAVLGPDGGSCPTPVTLAPAQTVEIYLDLSAAPSNLIFKVAPTVTLTTSSGTSLVSLPQAFDSTLTFADSSQLSCYDLQGDTFVPSSSFRPDDLADQSPCI
jgi:hypothetical protein